MSNNHEYNLSHIIIKIKPKSMFIYMFVLIVFLVIAHILGQLAIFNVILRFRGDDLLSLFFNLDGEGNIPTFYAVCLWSFCVILLVFIALLERKGTRYLYWFGLAGIFSFLLIDEFISFHEVSEQIFVLFNIKILFCSNAWVFIYCVVLALISFFYLRFMFNLPKKTRYLFVFSFIIFMLGATVTELLGMSYMERYGMDKYYHLYYITVEETLEMMGLLVFIYALASYLVDELGVSQIRIMPEKISYESDGKL